MRYRINLENLDKLRAHPREIIYGSELAALNVMDCRALRVFADKHKISIHQVAPRCSIGLNKNELISAIERENKKHIQKHVSSLSNNDLSKKLDEILNFLRGVYGQIN